MSDSNKDVVEAAQILLEGNKKLRQLLNVEEDKNDYLVEKISALAFECEALAIAHDEIVRRALNEARKEGVVELSWVKGAESYVYRRVAEKLRQIVNRESAKE